MASQLAALPTLLLLLLQMLQQGSPAPQGRPAGPAGKCSFAAQYTQRIVSNSTMGRMRTWHTVVLGQYSPLTSQLVLLFPTPEWGSELGQVRVLLADCGSPGRVPYTVVNQSDQHSVHRPAGTGVTVITIDYSALADRLATSKFRFCLELTADVSQSRIVGGAQSPMPNGCTVALRPAPTKTSPATVNGIDLTNGALPSALADHLWQQYRLSAVEATCCLVYGGLWGINGGNAAAAKSGSSIELVALCYTGAVCFVCSAVAAAYCLVGARTRAGKTILQPCPVWRWRHQRPPVTIICRYHVPDLCGPPYQHLLAHCRSVGSGVPISSVAAYRPAAASVL